MIPTPHIAATEDQIARTVIMPGDPIRSKAITDVFLENPVLVNNIRGAQGYTGTYKGKPVTVMASGMGQPSIGIYSYELFQFYGVDQIIRVGTMGGVSEATPLRSIVIGQRAYSNTNFLNFYIKNGNAPGYVAADEELCARAVAVAEAGGYTYRCGDIMSSDTYYADVDEVAICNRLGLLGIEMEGVALYLNAQRCGKKALCICTISNSIITGEELPVEERQSGFMHMARIALDLI
ncbi:MAG: purine-nucleoside phosphorylase [Bacteroidales bacterium]|nr:purine-nucleoside phosphorylase [Bacteroidales bacterium]